MAKRILIKLSGESLLSADGSQRVDVDFVNQLSKQIKSIQDLGVDVALVIGAGNLFRGRELVDNNISRIPADQVGMIATVQNAILVRDIMMKTGLKTMIMSAFAIEGMVDIYQQKKAIDAMKSGYCLILSGGLGTPLFSTDTAACARAIEIQADYLIKGTMVDGVYNKDPKKYTDAERYDRITYSQALQERLGFMDATALALSQAYQLKIHVCDIDDADVLLKVVQGDSTGTWISSEEV